MSIMARGNGPACPASFYGQARMPILRMNILRIGTDVVEVLRIAQMIERHGELFIQRVFTPFEIDYCNARKASTQHFSGRWAAKEAILKALGTGWARGISWTDMEVRNDEAGRPSVRLG